MAKYLSATKEPLALAHFREDLVSIWEILTSVHLHTFEMEGWTDFPEETLEPKIVS